MIAPQRGLKAALFVFALCSLTACMGGGGEPLPPETLTRLNGLWVQKDGNGTIRFYNDATVKLIMPDKNPPIRLLSTLEVMKDQTLAFSMGDRWHGPVRITVEKDWEIIHLHFPDKTDRHKEIIVDFIRSQNDRRSY